MPISSTPREFPPSPHSFASFRGVVFDFDGVIVDTEVAVYEAWREVFLAHGGDLPLALYAQCVGSDHGTWDPKAFLEETTGNLPDWPPVLEAKNQRTRDMLIGQGPMPGVLAWLESLHAAGMPMAVASSSSRDWVGGWLGQLGLLGYFHSLHCRGDVERVKPAPDLFLRAAAALCLPPEEILVIEDSANGLLAARAAGMAVLAVPNRITAGQDFSGAWHVAPGLDHVPPPGGPRRAPELPAS